MGGSSKFLRLLSSHVCSNIRLLSSFLSFSSRSAFLSLARGHCRVPLSYVYTVKNRRFSARTSCTGLGFSVKASEQLHTETSARRHYGDVSGFSQSSCFSHPWPEWVRLLDHLRSVGYFDREIPKVVGEEEIFSSFEELSEEFVRAANACLTFARDRSDLLGSLSRKDVEVVVSNGSPFLFKNTINSTRRMRAFLVNDRENILEFDRANTVDLMRFLLSYAFNALSASNQNNIQNWYFIEKSVRNLLIQLLDVSGSVGGSLSESMPRQYAGRPEQSTPRPRGQNIEMKKGDWICPKCSFMNFAKNTKCLECIEARPKRVLTGGEWECPQCDFFNYGRNTVCLRCDCKRPGPGETNFSSAPNSGLGYSQKPNIGYASDIRTSSKSEMESRLAINDEKAERWFSKVSQLNDVSDLSSAIADEDFPEIMPLRKGINRFVVSTRKTPLERRLANAQYRRNMDNGGSKGNDLVGNVGGMGSDKTETSISQSLDKILGCSETYRCPAEENSDRPAAGDKITSTDDPKYDPLERELASSHYRQSVANQGRDFDYVPFMPLPADMFVKSKKAACENNNSDPAKAEELTGSASVNSETAYAVGSGLSEKTENETEKKGDGKINDSTERYFKKFVELHDVTDLTSAISDPDFPEIMPIRQGENGFVISKDHSLTSPQYKRHLATEQANGSNFVPFVPYPPDYFAKKDKQPGSEALTRESVVDISSVSAKPENLSGSPIYNERSQVGASYGVTGNPTPQPENLQNNREKWNRESTRIFESKTNAAYGVGAGNSTQRPEYLLNNSESWNRESKIDAVARNPGKQPENLQNRENWNRGFSGKSLEGSAVKEPGPLDMSEEAKAERWFRRVAQIKDISELSQIPDEDFPEIMPMRKGVNRFVVSKRKTPLERRLTSPQYRRDLPIVSSDPDKKC